MNIDDEILYRVLSELNKLKDKWQAQLTINDIIQKSGEPKVADFYMRMEKDGLIETHPNHYGVIGISEKGKLILLSYQKKQKDSIALKRIAIATLIVAAIGTAGTLWQVIRPNADAPNTQSRHIQIEKPTPVKIMPSQSQSEGVPKLHSVAMKKSLRTDSISSPRIRDTSK